ncbi:MAG: uracil phosphoribosyltransferase [Cytophagales bacterium CG12_big_fil_rev_8_21_14_0_65_40_12]|nr:MAG: uracil phosphoribosyltransferase [Cytophagales bacterium CG12_big_fil_rev_8_21_14_0_65_40_12]PIW04370.1 MAG: uracil phosphoribosyltransferase [Cytophagales bacterium CG17_big_fil_post_rev_8_21_14_2_50_40_13]
MFVLNHSNSIANSYLADLRNIAVQEDRLRFRTNLERLGVLMAYEVSKTLDFESKTISTPLKETSVQVPNDDIVLIAVLRAALPFMDGFLKIFDRASVGFVGAWRKEGGGSIEVALDYVAAPDLNGKTLILVDPMLATGKSLVRVLNEILKNGSPKKMHFCSVISAPEGIDYVKSNVKMDYQMWTWAVDEKLNEQSYIVPGLGDAGDLSFGSKL